MSKRSQQFERRPRGLYPTPANAVFPLLRHLPNRVRFVEPCAGDGALVGHLEAAGHPLASASDIHPMADSITECYALDLDQCNGDMFITNPPWPEPNRRGEPTLTILRHLASLATTWLILPADFAHNVYFGEVESRCRKIVSVGRVRWIPGTKHTGKDNAAWYLFDNSFEGQITFMGGRRDQKIYEPVFGTQSPVQLRGQCAEPK